jgi:hypothetical protein
MNFYGSIPGEVGSKRCSFLYYNEADVRVMSKAILQPVISLHFAVVHQGAMLECYTALPSLKER